MKTAAGQREEVVGPGEGDRGPPAFRMVSEFSVAPPAGSVTLVVTRAFTFAGTLLVVMVTSVG